MLAPAHLPAHRESPVRTSTNITATQGSANRAASTLEAEMIGAAASSDYYLKRAEEARAKAATANHMAVHDQYIALARINELFGRRAAKQRKAA
jgi:hypothetical protein